MPLPAGSKCATCKKSIAGKPAGTRTCSDTCRKARARKEARARKRAAELKTRPPEIQDIASVVDRRNVRDAAHEALKEEIRPFVREELTEHVLQGIGRLVQLTPRAVQMLEADLESDDGNVRQRAYTLLLKYTMGNPSVAPASAEAQPPAMQVVFQVPGSESAHVETTAEEIPEDVPALPVAVRSCLECLVSRPTTEFVAGSDRCDHCHAALRARVTERFPDA